MTFGLKKAIAHEWFWTIKHILRIDYLTFWEFLRKILFRVFVIFKVLNVVYLYKVIQHYT